MASVPTGDDDLGQGVTRPDEALTGVPRERNSRPRIDPPPSACRALMSSKVPGHIVRSNINTRSTILFRTLRKNGTRASLLAYQNQNHARPFTPCGEARLAPAPIGRP